MYKKQKNLLKKLSGRTWLKPREDFAEILKEVTKSEDERERDMLHLYFVEDWSYEQIAEKYNLGVSRTSWLINHQIRGLRMKRSYFEWGIEERKAHADKLKNHTHPAPEILDIDFLKLSVSAFIYLEAKNIYTIGDLLANYPLNTEWFTSLEDVREIEGKLKYFGLIQ